MAQVQDRWVANLKYVRERADALAAQELPKSRWSDVQRDRQVLLDIIDHLQAQLRVAEARVMVLKTAQLVAAEGTQKRNNAGRDSCTCGHSRDSHEHYRAGTNCSLCECRNYRPASEPRQRAWT